MHIEHRKSVTEIHFWVIRMLKNWMIAGTESKRKIAFSSTTSNVNRDMTRIKNFRPSISIQFKPPIGISSCGKVFQVFLYIGHGYDSVSVWFGFGHCSRENLTHRIHCVSNSNWLGNGLVSNAKWIVTHVQHVLTTTYWRYLTCITSVALLSKRF